MAYTLATSREEFKGGKNILASEHLQFVEAGATLDATKFPVGHNELGLLIARNLTSGKYEPAVGLADATNHDNFSVLNIDFNNDGENDLIVGEVIVRGSVYLEKLPAEPTALFREQAPMIRFVSHV